MTDRAEAIRLVAAFVPAWNGRDVTALAEIFHPDFRWHIAVTDDSDPTPRRPRHEPGAGWLGPQVGRWRGRRSQGWRQR